MKFVAPWATGYAFTALALFGCSSDASSDTPNTGAQGTAGSATGGQGNGTETPDYEAAFPQDSVPTLNLTIAAEDWQRMLDDMTALAGDFGAGSLGTPMGAAGPDAGPGGAQLPAELLTACEGMAAGDPCTAELAGVQISGACTVSAGNTICQPASDGQGGLPDVAGGGLGGADLISATPIYVEASVEFKGRHWEHVGLRFKGNSSLASSWSGGSYKLPMRLNFDHFDDVYPETKKQRFWGFEQLSLSNGWSDPSLVRDKLGTDIFGDFGVPVPATAFYRVVVDHGEGPVYFGLYTAIELPSDHSFLDRSFGGHDGNLYKPEGTGATWSVFDTATLGKENHEDEADFSDASALFDALHADRTDSAAFRAGLEQRLNVDGFLRWLALNTLIQDFDTYGSMSHNYYLYADSADAGRFEWIPWDHTFAFGGAIGMGEALRLDLATVTDQWPLIRFLMDDAVYGAHYRELVAEAASAYSKFAESHFQAAHDLIAEFVVGPNGEIEQHTLLASPEEFETAHTTLLAHPAQRAAAAASFADQ